MYCGNIPNKGMALAFSRSFISKLERDEDRWGIKDCESHTMQFGPNTVGQETIQAVSEKSMVIKRQITALLTFKP